LKNHRPARDISAQIPPSPGGVGVRAVVPVHLTSTNTQIQGAESADLRLG
jgi:hypothetical protein